MHLKQCTPHSDSGFTILETLVAASLGLIILGLLLSSTISSKNLYQADVVRTRINQDLRGALDIIGTQVRVSGENLSWTFPAILIENDWNGEGSDRLKLRRNLADEILKVCVPLASGTNANIIFATGTAPGCNYSVNTHNYDAWRTFRIDEGGTVDAYVYNSGTKAGEFFVYDSETDASGEYDISRQGGSWQNDYDETASAAYLLEEWTFELLDDTLRLIVNDDTANPLNVAFGLTDFQVVAVLKDGTELNVLDNTSDWTELRAVRITLTGQESFRNKVIERTLSTEFFPRNVLSN